MYHEIVNFRNNKNENVEFNSILTAIEKMLKQTRKACQDAQARENELMDTLDSLGINLDETETNAENALNLKEAIICYTNYGEYSLDALVSEIDEALKAQGG